MGAGSCRCPRSATPLPLALKLPAEPHGDSIFFARVADIALGPDGRIHVVDGDARTVWMFDGDGRFERRIGRQGDGPGEFRYANAAGVAADGSVLVVDGLRWSAAVFDGEGRLVETRSLDPQPVVGQEEIAVTSDLEIHTVGYEDFAASLQERLGEAGRGLVRGAATLQRWDDEAGTWRQRVELPGFEVFADATT